MRGNETPSDWKDRIWNTLMVYKKNHLLTDYNKRYLIARKQTYLLYQCNVCGYEYFYAFFIDKHWRANCIENEYCDMSFEDYMKLKNNLVPPCYFTKKVIR
ncbi:hypothetical protein RhiirA1_421732 [Rhizophagus irregularis]|uniref:Uncharacterized protein n=1 Tax=Rhizophagus irregularis TaxID=588596 RepID=A0A2N0RLY2_9GLOM|nr:hypothetical protein RhiirA1_421732 [Rhizophagus irregularis]